MLVTVNGILRMQDACRGIPWPECSNPGKLWRVLGKALSIVLWQLVWSQLPLISWFYSKRRTSLLVSDTQREKPGKTSGWKPHWMLCAPWEAASAAEPPWKDFRARASSDVGGWWVHYYGRIRNPIPDSQPAQAPLQPQSPHIWKGDHSASELLLDGVVGGADNCWVLLKISLMLSGVSFHLIQCVFMEHLPSRHLGGGGSGGSTTTKFLPWDTSKLRRREQKIRCKETQMRIHAEIGEERKPVS